MSWRPAADWSTLELRARALATVRGFFAARGIVEVQTPAIVRHAVTDPHLANVKVSLTDAAEAWLHTSPEYHMKRLLAAGAPDIYQLGAVYRDGERGQRHEPEFTMIEWYRRDLDLPAMIDETCALLRELAAVSGRNPGEPVVYEYATLFAAAVGLDPLTAGAADLRDRARALLGDRLTASAEAGLADDTSAWLDLLMSHVVGNELASRGLCVVRGYPACQAALARLSTGDPRTAERFEVFYRGMELANGYRELTDPAEQRHRFAADRARRSRLGLRDVAPDEHLLAALDEGLPDCSGVAVGFDRALMGFLECRSIRDVIAFPAAG